MKRGEKEGRKGRSKRGRKMKTKKERNEIRKEG